MVKDTFSSKDYVEPEEIPINELRGIQKRQEQQAKRDQFINEVSSEISRLKSQIRDIAAARAKASGQVIEHIRRMD
jgi:hypothetical protein